MLSTAWPLWLLASLLRSTTEPSPLLFGPRESPQMASWKPAEAAEGAGGGKEQPPGLPRGAACRGCRALCALLCTVPGGPQSSPGSLQRSADSLKPRVFARRCRKEETFPSILKDPQAPYSFTSQTIRVRASGGVTLAASEG